MPESAPPQDAVSVIDQEFITDEPCALAVDVPGAVVHLRPRPDPDRVEIEISVSGCPPEEAEAVLDRLQVGAQKMKETVQVYSNGDHDNAEWWRWVRTQDATIHVDLSLPPQIEADLRVAGGDIDLADLKGDVHLQVMGGACRVDNLEGSLDIRAESSDVTVENFSGEQVDARVAVGSLTLEDVEADRLALRSVAAPVRLRDVRGTTTVTANSTDVDIRDVTGPWTVESHGGPVVFDAPPTDETELTVVGAPLDVRVPANHAADLHMSGRSLSLDEDLAFDGERTEDVIEGTLNDGGPPLRLRVLGESGECQVQASDE